MHRALGEYEGGVFNIFHLVGVVTGGRSGPAALGGSREQGVPPQLLVFSGQVTD